MADPREHPALALSVIAGLSGVLLCSCSPDTTHPRRTAAAISSARLVEPPPESNSLPTAERLEAQVQATCPSPGHMRDRLRLHPNRQHKMHGSIGNVPRRLRRRTHGSHLGHLRKGEHTSGR